MKDSPSIPVLDLSSPDFVQLSRDFVHHLSNVGFIYLQHHGVAQNLIDETREAAKEFFAKDYDFKMISKMTDKTVPWGFRPFETERLDPEAKIMDAKEVIMFNAHDPSSNNWPTPRLGETTTSLIDELGELTRRLLKMLGVGLDLKDSDVFLNAHSFLRGPDGPKSQTSLRFNHYPFLERSEMKDGQVNCSEHFDWGTVTLLMQDDVSGLEAQTSRDGEYVEALPIEGTILVNIGLMLENWTNGRLRATKHRVTKHLARERMSVVLFVQPDIEVDVEPLEELVAEGSETAYLKTSSGGFVKHMISKTIQESAFEGVSS